MAYKGESLWYWTILPFWGGVAKTKHPPKWHVHTCIYIYTCILKVVYLEKCRVPCATHIHTHLISLKMELEVMSFKCVFFNGFVGVLARVRNTGSLKGVEDARFHPGTERTGPSGRLYRLISVWWFIGAWPLCLQKHKWENSSGCDKVSLEISGMCLVSVFMLHTDPGGDFL